MDTNEYLNCRVCVQEVLVISRLVSARTGIYRGVYHVSQQYYVVSNSVNCFSYSISIATFLAVVSRYGGRSP
jgi:hypothetical protein